MNKLHEVQQKFRRTIQDWNQLPAEVLGTLPCKPNTLKESVRIVINDVS